ncbi:hypothetical protein LCGC14_1474400 [marine sediment metagenome]|uniref:Phage capsid-like C-terminal domain-containing protein n=1 Tax=marine sediment metagenome TaxID=412755 RepID=A0A0F9MD32_9ZZZZ
MLRDELIIKMRASHAKIPGLEGDELTRETAVFDELTREVERGDVIWRQEQAVMHTRETEDFELWDVFGQLMRGEHVEDVARDALSIRENGIKDRAGPGAFRLPGDGYAWMSASSDRAVGDVARAPAGSISSDISNLLKCPPLTPIFQLPLPPTPLFDKATKVPAIDGVAIPFLVQTAADPFASVNVTCGVGEAEDKPESSIPADGKCTITTDECAGSTIISDKALRRVPAYEAIIADFMRGALKFQIETNIVVALNADGNVVLVPRAVAAAVGWTDLVDLEGAIPWYWAVSGEYAMCQDAQTFLKRTLGAVAPGYPLYNVTTAASMYTSLNGRPFFLDAMSALGVSGDVFYGDYSHIFVGIGQDIAFRRTNEGATLVKANSTMFAVFSDIGYCIPVGGVFAKLYDVGGSQSPSLSPSPSP